LLFIYYAARGVDYLTPIETYAYVGFFYRAVPVLLLLTAVVHLCVWRRPRDGARLWVTAPACALAGVLWVVTLTSADIGRIVPAGHNYAEGAQVFEDLGSESGGPIVLKNVTGEVWATGAGLGLALHRDGADWCITGANAERIMFGDQVCTRREVRRGLVVRLTDLDVPPGASVVWDDEPDAGDPASPRLRPGPIRAYLAP
jgi:hypothetical protein